MRARAVEPAQGAAPSARWVARVWLVLVVSSAFYFLADNEADNDLWVHLFSGARILAHGQIPRVDDASYTAAGAPWIDHEWLTQVALAQLFAAGGSPALWLTKLLVGLLTAWLVWQPLRRVAAAPWARGAAMVLVLAVMARGYAVRPQIVTYLGVAALLAWLDHLDQRRATMRTFLIIAAGFALWANAHGAVIAGLAILTIYAALGADGGVATRTRVGLFLTALAAACLTPYGPALFGYIGAELRAPHPLGEWQPVALLDPAQRPFALLLGALLVTLPFARLLRQRWWWAAIVAGVGFMAVRAQRHTPLFAICAAAPLADQLDGALRWLAARAHLRLSAPAAGALAVGLGALAAVQLIALTRLLARDHGALVFAADDYPVGAVTYLRGAGIRGNLALPLDWGGYALFHAAPEVKVSLDGRFATVYSADVVEDTFAFFRGAGDRAAARLLDAYQTTLALVPRGVRTAVDQRPEWRVLYIDEVATLYGRDGPAAGAPSSTPRGRRRFP